MNITVCITGWKRPHYFGQIIKALTQNYEYDNYNYVVSIDYPGDKDTQELQKDIFENSSLANQPHEVFLHEGRKGCAGNVGFGFKKAFELFDSDAVIMLEDDTMPSKDFLIFMRKMLEEYKDDERIFSISGYIRRVYEKKNVSSAHETYEGEGEADKIYERDWFTSWGWATWRSVYEEIGDDWFGVTWNGKEGKTGPDTPKGEKFLEYVNVTNQGSWAWTMNRYWRGDRKEVAPDVSRIQNIGAEGGMFAPGGRWHRDNHHVEIWMGSNIYEEKDYEYRHG